LRHHLIEDEARSDGNRALEAVSAVGGEADGSDRSRVGGVEGRVDGGHLPSVEHDGAGRAAKTQLTRLTWTFASPGHFCEETASVIVPPFPVM